mgnify:CR=1 FL=1
MTCPCWAASSKQLTGSGVRLLDPVVNDYLALSAVVRPLARAPVNANTASAETLAERARDAGYATAAFVSARVLGAVDRLPVDAKLLVQAQPAWLKQHLCFPVRGDDGRLLLVMVDPLDQAALKEAHHLFGELVDVPPENVLAMADAAREFGVYPLEM